MSLEESESTESQMEEMEEEMEEMNNSSSLSTFSSSSGSPVSVSNAPPPPPDLTFNSHVMVKVEEFIYFSVKLGIRFQLLNNNIVVGPSYEGDVPLPVADMVEALRKKADRAVIEKARVTLQVAEAIEREEDFATLHCIARDDLYALRRHMSKDDDYYCKGLFVAYGKNTFLTYPPPKSDKNEVVPRRKKSVAFSPKAIMAKKRTPEDISLMNGLTVTRARDGSISLEAVQHLTLNEAGGIQDKSDEEKSRLNPISTPQASPTHTHQSQDDNVETEEKERDGNVVSDRQEASWADEQQPDVQTYYISASAAALSSTSSSTSPLAQATVTSTTTATARPLNSPSPNTTTTQVGVDPRSPSLSSTSRSPAQYHNTATTTAVTIEAVPINNMTIADNLPFDRPPSLSVQQEFMLRNGSIRSDRSASNIDKSSLRTGAIKGIDLSADMSFVESDEDDNHEKDILKEEEGSAARTVASKIVVQCTKHLGVNVKKVWKFDMPVELSSADIRDLTEKLSSKPTKGQQDERLLQNIVALLVKKFSFPSPYYETTSDILKGLDHVEDIDLESDPEGNYDFEEECDLCDSKHSGTAKHLPGRKRSVVASGIVVNKMMVMYFDDDVDDFVSLDVDTLEDFTGQTKKALRIDYTPLEVSVVRYIPSEEGDVDQNVSKEEGEDEVIEEQEEKVEVTESPTPDKNVVVSSIVMDTSEENVEVVVPIPSISSEWTDEDKMAESSPYGHWRWITRRNIGKEDESLLSEGGYLDSTVESCLSEYYVGPTQWSTLVAVNGIRMKDLEKPLVFSMLKQRQRPMVLEFENRHGTSSSNSHPGAQPLSSGKADDKKKLSGHLPASTFLAKYTHPAAKSLRKQVEKLLKNFDEYDWSVSGASGDSSSGSSPQVFVTSLYRSVESELENLGLFDSATPQGGGVPEMTESHWADVRMHIETLVFNSIYEHVKAMAPPPEVYELYSSPVSGAPDQRSMVPLQTKFAFLSFLSLRDMGMDLPNELQSPRVYSLASTTSKGAVNNDTCYAIPEEWRLGIKELCRATEMRSPLKIMQRFRHAVMLLTHAIESLIGRPLKYTQENAVQESREEADSLNAMRQTDRITNVRDKNVIVREFIRPAGYYAPVTLGADELMPVLSWAIIQANPPAIEMAVWLCGEFRHPNNHMGEGAYTLTQVSSALEFVKAATWRDFEVEEPYFREGIQRYEATQDLILECRKGIGGHGDLDSVRKCLARGADVNGLSVEKSESPLSAAIKSKHLEVVKLLLNEDDIDINLRISPYFPTMSAENLKSKDSSKSSGSGNKGGKGKKDSNKKEALHDYTALMLAAFTGQLAMVVLLLDHGADRYLINEAGDTATSLARTAGHREVVRVLIADPTQFSLFELIAKNDVFVMRGMLLQESTPVNDMGVICSYCTGGDETAHEVHGTCVHSAVYFREVDVISILLNSHRVDVNKSSSNGETALMWCGASDSIIDHDYTFDSKGTVVIHSDATSGEKDNLCAGDEDISRVQIACGLLKEQADRYAIDQHGRNAFHWAKYGNGIASSTSASHPVSGRDGVAWEELPFIATECRYPRLAAVLYYDPARFRIYHLARDGCLAGVRALLDQGVSINDSCPDGWYTPLIAAVFNKDISMVRFLLQYSSIEVNFKGKHQITALHYAAQEGSLAVCGLLLFHNADRTALTTNGLLPIDYALSKSHKDVAACLRFDPAKVSICLAAKHGDMSVFAALINQGVSINAKLRHVSEKGTHHELTTPLISAVAFGQLEFIRQVMATKDSLLANAYHYTNIMKSTKCSGEDLDIDATNFIGQTALMYAAAAGDEDMTLYLLKLGAERSVKDKEGRTAAQWAKNSNRPQIYMILVCDPKHSTVHQAIRDGNMDATIAFFKQDPNPNVRFFSSLLQNTDTTTSISTGNNHHVSLNAAEHHPQGGESILDGESPLIVAAKYGRLAIVRLLFRAPEIEIDNVDTFGKTALMHACEQGHEDVVLLLLKHKSSRGAMCYSQKRAIDYAAASKHADIVDILDADPYKVHIQDAAENGNTRHVNALLKQGCPPNYQDERTGKRNRTALMCAASKGRLNVIKLLLSLSTSQSINVDIQDADGMTALMHGAKIGNLEVTAALLNANCRRDIKDARGRTAQSHASSHGFITGTQFKAQLMWR